MTPDTAPNPTPEPGIGPATQPARTPTTHDGQEARPAASQRPTHASVSAAAAGEIATEWTLNPAQWAFVTSEARFSLYIGGVGAGKTFAGAARAIMRMIEQPGALGLIGAPTFPMLRDATQRAFFELLPRPLIQAYHKSEERLVLRNGAEVLFRSLDQPDRARGLNLAWFWLDEAPLCGYYAWQVLKGRLRQPGFATAGWATGTPHGRDGFASDFELAPRRNHALFRASTYANAHHLPPDFIAELGYSGSFAQQEVLGLFVAFEGLVYSFDASPQGHLRVPPAGSQWARVIGGVDWGYTNPSAALVFGVDGDGRAWQLDEFYQRRAGLEATLLPALLDLTRRYGVGAWYCGPDEPEHIAALAAALAREGLPTQALRADNAVQAGIQTVAGLLAPRGDGSRGLYVAPGCLHTIAEYASYQYASAASGAAPARRDASEQPLKQNDHAMDACLVAGTLVETDRGPLPIERLRAGDCALTRHGYRRVLWAGATNASAQVIRATFTNGAALVGTPQHPVYELGVGFVPMQALRAGEVVVTSRGANVRVASLAAHEPDGQPLREQAVYNLEVADAHEYFAQDILVHNCRYALHTALGQTQSAETYLAGLRRRIGPGKQAPQPPT